MNSPSNANWFSGLPSGTLYRLNQSTVASRYPGFSRLTSSISTTANRKPTLWVAYSPTVPLSYHGTRFILLKLPASGSSVLITMTFQSVSPSSMRARIPSTFTLMTSPREHTWGLEKYHRKVSGKSNSSIEMFLFVFQSGSLGRLQHLIAYVTDIDRVVVSTASCVAVLVMGVLPSLRKQNTQLSWSERVMFLSSGRLGLTWGIAP